MTTNHRYTTDLTAAKPSRFGTTPGEYVDTEKQYRPAVETDYTVIEAGGARLARTTNGVTSVITTIGDIEVAQKVRNLVTSLTQSLPSGLYRLAAEAAGRPLDLPRLGRHIWDTGVDPWNLPQGSTRDLAHLSQLTADLPQPVRAAIATIVFQTWDHMGPILVPARATYIDSWDHDEYTEHVDISAVMATASDTSLTWMATSGSGEHGMFAALSWLDSAAARVMSECDLEEGVTVSLEPQGRAAARAWIELHRPDLIPSLGDEG